MLRVQERVSVEVLLPHEPPPHVYVVTVRDCVPVVSQVLVKPPHAPHDPYVVEPQEFPLVLRVQASVSLAISVVHDPSVQRGIMRIRDRVPVSSHTSEKPPQAPHAPAVVLPQSGSVRHSMQVSVASSQNAGHGGAG